MVVIEMENGDKIKIELYPEIAPESEKIPASQQTGNDISSVPACRSFLQNMFDIDILFDRIVHRLTGQALGLESPVEVFHLIIQ